MRQSDYDRTYVILDMLVTQCLRAQEEEYIRFEDARMIRMAPPRRLGLTTAIQAVSRRFGDPMFGAPTMEIIRHTMPHVPENRILSPGNLKYRRGTIGIDAIFFDATGKLSAGEEEDLIGFAKACAAGKPRFCLALLG